MVDLNTPTNLLLYRLEFTAKTWLSYLWRCLIYASFQTHKHNNNSSSCNQTIANSKWYLVSHVISEQWSVPQSTDLTVPIWNNLVAAAGYCFWKLASNRCLCVSLPWGLSGRGGSTPMQMHVETALTHYNIIFWVLTCRSSKQIHFIMLFSDKFIRNHLGEYEDEKLECIEEQ